MAGGDSGVPSSVKRSLKAAASVESIFSAKRFIGWFILGKAETKKPTQEGLNIAYYWAQNLSLYDNQTKPMSNALFFRKNMIKIHE
jgi:hypothetical protein